MTQTYRRWFIFGAAIVGTVGIIDVSAQIPLSPSVERDGNVVRLFSYPKYYWDENGQLKEARTEFTQVTFQNLNLPRPDGVWAYEMREAEYQVWLRSDGTIHVKHFDWEVEYRLEDLALYDPVTQRSKSLGQVMDPSRLQVVGNTATWVDYYPGIDFRITLLPVQLKEEVVIHSRARETFKNLAPLQSSLGHVDSQYIVAKMRIKEWIDGSYTTADNRGATLSFSNDVQEAKLRRMESYQDYRSNMERLGQTPVAIETYLDRSLEEYRNQIIEPTEHQDIVERIHFQSASHRGHAMPPAYAWLLDTSKGSIDSNSRKKMLRHWQVENNTAVLSFGLSVFDLNNASEGDVIYDPDLDLDYDDMEYVYVIEDAPMVHYSAKYPYRLSFIIGTYAADNKNYVFMKFNNINDVTTGSIIQSANLRLYCDWTYPDKECGVAKILFNWNAANDDLNFSVDPVPGQSYPREYPCYQYRAFNENPPHTGWGTGGIAGTDNIDYDDACVIALEEDTYNTWNVTDIVQDWINNPDHNKGFFLYPVDSTSWNNYAVFFHGPSNPSVYLEITYVETTPTATPTVTPTPTNTPTPLPSPAYVWVGGDVGDVTSVTTDIDVSLYSVGDLVPHWATPLPDMLYHVEINSGTGYYSVGSIADVSMVVGDIQSGTHAFRVRAQSTPGFYSEYATSALVELIVYTPTPTPTSIPTYTPTSSPSPTLSPTPTPTSTPIFGELTAYETGKYPRAITSGDFDDDGDVDIAVSNQFDRTVSLYANLIYGETYGVTETTPGRLTAYPHSPLMVGEEFWSLSSEDINRDGYIDLVGMNDGPEPISVLYGNGDATFQVPVHFGLGTGPRKADICDLDRDGYPDVIMIESVSGAIQVRLKVDDAGQ